MSVTGSLAMLEMRRTVESVFGQSIVVTVQDLLEGLDGVLQRDQSTLDTSENLGDGERLRHESLDLSGSLDGELVLFRQFVHTHYESKFWSTG